MRNEKATRDRLQTPSGAVGGPAAGSGLNFQVDFAIRHALDAISSALADPLTDFQIAVEPRLVTGGHDTRWDIRRSHPERLTEVKLRPSRLDIEDWLDRVARVTQHDDHVTLELSYGRGAGPLITAIENLCRIAREANGNIERFDELITLERTPAIDAVLRRLTVEPHLALLRVNLAPIDRKSLEREIQFQLRHLVPDQDRTRLYEFLFAKFHKGIEQRATYRVRDLINEAAAARITFSAPPTSMPAYLAPVVSSALYILQHCEIGLPSEALAAGVGCSEREVDSALSKHIRLGGLSRDADFWEVGRLQPPLVRSSGSQLISKTLRQLLEFIGRHRKNARGWRQVPNAIALAKVCQSEHHELASALFWNLDKLLKRTGNKHLVFEVANMSLAAARRSPRTEAKTRGEAVALICGRTWVLQRIGRLAEARADGERSLQLGNDIEWHRNTAFCLKCLGRLFRMEAEQHPRREVKFRELLDSSISHLERAKQSFHTSTELSEAERNAEVGDCLSLLGRSHLVAGDLLEAKAAAREAVRLLVDKTSKDYADLQILLGDLANADNDVDAAVSYYDAAIIAAGTADAERSEIAARALLERGLVTSSKTSFDRAAEIWEALEEDEPAADARWHSLLVSGRVSIVAQEVLTEEPASVRVEAIRLYEADVAQLAPSHGRRFEAPADYWLELLPEARKIVAVRHIEW